MVKRSICILFTVLFAFSAMSISAFAKSEYSQSTPRIIDLYETKYLEMNRGESYTLHYKNLTHKNNVSVPNGGHIVWAAVYASGFVDGQSSEDGKSCTITATNSGICKVAAFVYDAKDNILTTDFVNVYINYKGVRGAIDERTEREHTKNVALFLWDYWYDLLPMKHL